MKQIICGGKGSGKTTLLLKYAHNRENCYIVTKDMNETQALLRLAKRLNVKINMPITFYEIVNKKFGHRVKELVYDDIDRMIESLTYNVDISIMTVGGEMTDIRFGYTALLGHLDFMQYLPIDIPLVKKHWESLVNIPVPIETWKKIETDLYAINTNDIPVTLRMFLMNSLPYCVVKILNDMKNNESIKRFI